jgi:hypothetical protein
VNNLSLLREKFIIRDIDPDVAPVVAMGNRLVLQLEGLNPPLIIRGHSMHITLRFGAEILKNNISRLDGDAVHDAFQWKDLWAKITKDFEEENTPESWITVYFKGEIIYQFRTHHQFFDILEHCEYKNNGDDNRYETSISMAQKAFQKSGKTVLIDQESHVGFILDSYGAEKKFAVILRLPSQKATFITRLSKDKKIDKTPYDYICMNLAADFIEAINMAVRAGFIMPDAQKKSANYNIKSKYKILQQRMGQLSLSINQAERQYVIKYRPEKPDFETIQSTCAEK